MIKLLRLIFGHVHEWEIIEEYRYKKRYIDSPMFEEYTIKLQKCKHCGKLKKFKCGGV